MKTNEELINRHVPQDARVQYDNDDGRRIADVTEFFVDRAVRLISALGSYQDVLADPIGEDTKDNVIAARELLVHEWAEAQHALSSVAFCMRIDGSTAFARLVEYMNDPDKLLDMRGL